MKKNNLKMWIVAALFAAITGVFAQIVIPLPLVPMTGQTLAIGLAVTILGLRYGVLSILLYILLGAIGMPVFSGMTGGLAVLVGPTGGFIVGFIACAFVIGGYLKYAAFTKINIVIANVLGMLVTLLFGAIWLKIGAHLSWQAALATGVLPFIIPGVFKAVAAAILGLMIRERLEKARLLPKIS